MTKRQQQQQENQPENPESQPVTDTDTASAAPAFQFDEAQSMARLEGMAAETEPPQIAPELIAQQEQEAKQITVAESLAGMFQLLSMGAGIAGYQRVNAVWNQGACLEFAGKVVPVMAKYAWGQKVIAMLEGGPGVEEMALLAVTVNLMVLTIGAVKADQADMLIARQEAQAGAE